MWLCKIFLLVLNSLKKLNNWTFFLLFVIAISQCGCFLQAQVNVQYDPTVSIIFLTYNIHAILKHMWESWSYSGFGTSIELGNHWCSIDLCHSLICAKKTIMERAMRGIIYYILILHTGKLPWKNMHLVPESLPYFCIPKFSTVVGCGASLVFSCLPVCQAENFLTKTLINVHHI